MIALPFPEVERIVRFRSFLTVCLFGLIFFLSNIEAELYGQSPNLYQRAPDVIPGTLPEMRTASYWINRMDNPQEVVMTQDRIEAMNRSYQQRIKSFLASDGDTGRRIREQLTRSPGLFAYRPDINSKLPTEISETVRDIIDEQMRLLNGRLFGNKMGVQYANHELGALEKEMSYNTISDEIHPQPGITVSDSRLRIIPELRNEYVGLTQLGKSRWDVWNLDVLPIASPVQILHVSKSGGHLFVFTDNGYGWMKSEDVAIASQSEIDNFIYSADFIVSISDRVPFYSSSNTVYVSGWIRMGARLPLANTDNHRVVQVPVRQINGELSVQNAWLLPDADVHRGLMPYTRENVVELGFTMLDNLYDWTGGWYGRNDGTVIRDMFKTFGFDIPANGVFLSLFSEDNWVSSAEDPREKRYTDMISTSPFTTFMTSRSGHSLLYLGEHNNEPVVFDTHGYGYVQEDGTEIEIRRWSVATLSLPDYLLRQDVTITNIK